MGNRCVGTVVRGSNLIVLFFYVAEAVVQPDSPRGNLSHGIGRVKMKRVLGG
jgi:hypothetical protein